LPGRRLERRDEVEILFEDERKREWIEIQMAKYRDRSDPASIPRGSPLGFGPIAEWQSHAVAGIPDPVHGSQNQPGGKAVKEMILDHQRSTSDPLHFRHQCAGVGGVVKDIDGHRDVVFPVPERQSRSIEFADRDRNAGANQHIDAFDSEIWPHLEDCLGQQAISAADVQHPRRFRKQWSDG
jgi:hypothetical protein